MSEHVKILEKCREALVAMRRKAAELFIAYGGPHGNFPADVNTLQEQIEAIDRAIADELQHTPNPAISPDYVDAVKKRLERTKSRQ